MIQGFRGRRIIAGAPALAGAQRYGRDSRLDLPSVEHSRSRLDDVELRPFRQAIEASIAPP